MYAFSYSSFHENQQELHPTFWPGYEWPEQDVGDAFSDANVTPGAAPAGTDLAAELARLRALERAEEARTEKNRPRIVFARGRIKAILAVLRHHHAGPCDTDDAEVYAGLVVPHFVEWAALDHRASFEDARLWFAQNLPGLLQAEGLDGLSRRWSEASQARSEAESAKLANATYRDVPYLFWLPKAAEIARALNVTRAVRDAINGRAAALGQESERPWSGLPVIDPETVEEKRERDRLRKAEANRVKGRIPQSERNKTAQFQAYADAAGCHLNTIKNHAKNGTLDGYLKRKGVAV